MGDAGLHRTRATIGWKTYRRATSGNAGGVAGSGTSTRREQKRHRCRRPSSEPTSTSHSNGSTARLSGEYPGALGRAQLGRDSVRTHPCHQVDPSRVVYTCYPGATRAAPTQWALFPHLSYLGVDPLGILAGQSSPGRRWLNHKTLGLSALGRRREAGIGLIPPSLQRDSLSPYTGE